MFQEWTIVSVMEMKGRFYLRRNVPSTKNKRLETQFHINQVFGSEFKNILDAKFLPKTKHLMNKEGCTKYFEAFESFLNRYRSAVVAMGANVRIFYSHQASDENAVTRFDNFVNAGMAMLNDDPANVGFRSDIWIFQEIRGAQIMIRHFQKTLVAKALKEPMVGESLNRAFGQILSMIHFVVSSICVFHSCLLCDKFSQYS